MCYVCVFIPCAIVFLILYSLWTSSFDADTDHPLFSRYVPLRTFEKECHAERRIARQNPVEILSNPTSVTSNFCRISTSVTTFPKLCCHHCRNPTPASVGFRQLFDVSNFSGKVADINPHQFCIGIFEFSPTFVFIFVSQQSPSCVTHCPVLPCVPMAQVHS